MTTTTIDKATGEVLSVEHTTREAWLESAIDAIRPYLAQHGAVVPERVHVSIGFGHGSQGENRVIRGQCWASSQSADGAPHVFISPVLGTAFEALRTLLHELVHAADDCRDGHRGRFATWARAAGLVGKMTTSEAGPELTVWLGELAERLGAYPHPLLSTGAPIGPRPEPGEGDPEGDPEDEPRTSAPRKQGTRNVKLVCPIEGCGNTCRSTRKWIDAGLAPVCPCLAAHGVVDLSGSQMIEVLQLTI